MQSTDIRELERKTLLTTFKKIVSENKAFKFVLVVDTPSLPILASLVSTSELVELGIGLTERYDLKRKPFPCFQAIYLLQSDTSINQFISDFSSNPPMYAAAHLTFTSTCNPLTMKALEEKPAVVGYIQSFIDLFINFRPMEPMFFLTPCRFPFNSLYSPTPKVPFLDVSFEAIRGLISFFITIKASPNIAFPKGFDKLVSFQNAFREQLKDAIGELENPSSITTNDTLLVIFPRHYDKIVPLLHSFTYQTMIYEHLNVENETLKVSEKDDSDVISLNPYDDKIFQESMYYHFTDFHKITDKAKEIVANLKKIKESTDKTSPEYLAALKKYISMANVQSNVQSHMDVVFKLDNIFTSRKLYQVSLLEQRIATRIKMGEGDERDKEYKPNFNDLQTICITNGPDSFDKLRAIGTYVAGGTKLKDEELNRLLESATIDASRWKSSITNMSLLPEAPKRDDPTDPGTSEILTNDVYFPYSAQVALDAVDNKLNSKVWDFPKHSGRYHNIVVYFMGGVSYAELDKFNLIRSRIKSTKIFVGATNALTPKQYLAQIKSLK